MANLYQLSSTSLDALFAALLDDGRRILAPTDRDGHSELNPVQTPADVARDCLQTTLSAKGAVFPKVEQLLGYSLAPGQVQLADPERRAEPTVLFGIRPCEAAGFQALDAVFNWGTRDAFFNARMASLAVIGMSCTRSDEACFCTSVGGGPGATRGSDILLTPTAGGYLAEVLSDRGRAIQALAPELFSPAPADADQAVLLAQVPVAFDQPALTAQLPALFDSPLWEEQALRCVGCGACAFVCPTCVCFDIQEEGDKQGGRRLRTWDACGFSQFTLHASGHNPRPTQAARWRQRVYHKFSIYPDRYGQLGCVGCGKCTRACPVDMNLREHLLQASQAQAQAQAQR
jgi:formate hydrogenlyase subunit 6/NADH:ubiquinone oxidoreductase subunit I